MAGRHTRGRDLAVRAGSLLLLLAIWQVGAVLAASRALPTPVAVGQFIATEAVQGELVANIVATLRRVVLAFAVAMAIGCAVGVALGRSTAADTLFDPWLLALLNAPALVVAVLCYIWLGLGETAAIVAVALNKIPNVVVILREGARSLDPGLEEMARVYRFSYATWARHVLAPQLAPFIAAAARSGLALVWKIVLLVELLGRPDGVGYAISVYFQLFDVRAVLGYAVAFMAVMLAAEFLVLQPLEARARRWRLAAA